MSEQSQPETDARPEVEIPERDLEAVSGGTLHLPLVSIYFPEIVEQAGAEDC
jgi:hypothetical protein